MQTLPSSTAKQWNALVVSRQTQVQFPTEAAETHVKVKEHIGLIWTKFTTSYYDFFSAIVP